MDTLKALAYFTRALELGSLSAAARELGTTQPTLSKALAMLESQLEVRLFERSTRGLAPTPQGAEFYEHAKGMLEQYDAALGALRGGTRHAAGSLRINAPVALGQFHINALVQEFLALHPAVSIELILNDRFVDLVEEGVDVAVRLGGELPRQAVGRHVAQVARFLVASPAYLDKSGTPGQPADLTAHAFVRFAWTPGGSLTLERGGVTEQVETSGRYRVNNALAIRDALVGGAGIGLCPEWLVDDCLRRGELVRVLPDWSAQPQQLYLLYPSRRYQPMRAQLFIRSLMERLASLPGCRPPQSSNQ